jgi:hypothetical protein
VAAVVKVVARLTRLKQLALKCLSQLKDPALLQLTALTALRQLTLATRWTPEYRVCFTSKVCLQWWSSGPAQCATMLSCNLADNHAWQLAWLLDIGKAPAARKFIRLHIVC